jgi:hypothetical protein
MPTDTEDQIAQYEQKFSCFSERRRFRHKIRGKIIHPLIERSPTYTKAEDPKRKHSKKLPYSSPA